MLSDLRDELQCVGHGVAYPETGWAVHHVRVQLHYGHQATVSIGRYQTERGRGRGWRGEEDPDPGPVHRVEQPSLLLEVEKAAWLANVAAVREHNLVPPSAHQASGHQRRQRQLPQYGDRELLNVPDDRSRRHLALASCCLLAPTGEHEASQQTLHLLLLRRNLLGNKKIPVHIRYVPA